MSANQLLKDAEDDSEIAQFLEFQNEKVVFLIKKLLEYIDCQDILKYETRGDRLGIFKQHLI